MLSGEALGPEVFSSVPIVVSVLEGGDISVGSGTVGLLHLSNFEFLVSFCQEYERAVIFRLGWLLSGVTRGPEVYSISLYLSLLSGIRKGGDIPAGSAVVWWSPGSGGLLHLSILVSVVRNTRGQ